MMPDFSEWLKQINSYGQFLYIQRGSGIIGSGNRKCAGGGGVGEVVWVLCRPVLALMEYKGQF